ncbi:MAG: ABC transporter permease [Pseudomonadota bacterium]
MGIFLGALEQSLLLLPLVFGIYLSYRILRVTDLTMDGTYILGAAVYARMIDFGPIQAMSLSVLAGGFIGVLVGFMQRHNRVSDLVVGILASFMLYSVNLQVLGRPNISLIGKQTLLTGVTIDNWVTALLIIAVILYLGMVLLLKSKMGLYLRAFGENQKLLHVLGKPAEGYRAFGLSLGNALASLSGALTASVNGFADINMGLGVALIGIGAVVIGGQILINPSANFHAFKGLASCFLGILLYFLCLNILLMMGVNPVNLKLILGLILFFSLRSMRFIGVMQ